jgi:hypothetical protein
MHQGDDQAALLALRQGQGQGPERVKLDRLVGALGAVQGALLEGLQVAAVGAACVGNTRLFNLSQLTVSLK